MTPPCYAFPPSDLPRQVQGDVKGKKRKLEGGANVDLSKCDLREMQQYRCFVDNPELPGSPVRCWAVNRFFRQCQDKKGSFMVETTAWEGMHDRQKEARTDTGPKESSRRACQFGNISNVGDAPLQDDRITAEGPIGA